MKLSHSAQASGWQDYPGEQWDQRKPIDWLPDWAFWQYCVERYGTDAEQKILDLACGNGRITRQIAALGYSVVAVDLNPHFLSRAQMHLPEALQSQVEFVLADAVQLDLKQQFPLILMTDWAFPAILSTQDLIGFFQKIVLHLVPNGVFAFDTIWANTRQRGLEFLDGQWQWPGENRYFDMLRQIETRYSGQIALKFRHSSLHEIELLGQLTGLAIIEAYGQTDRRPLLGHPDDNLTLVMRKTHE